MDDLLQTTLPISGLSPIVGDGQDPDLISRLKIDDVKREARHRTSSHRNICRDARHQRTSVREHDLIDRGVNGVEELDAEVLPMVLVPSTRETVFRVCFFFEPNVRFTDDGVQPRRAVGRLPRGCRPIRQS